MIDLVRLKRLLAVGVLLVASLVGVVVLRQAGAAVLRAATGADPTAAFNEIPPAPAELRRAIDWLPDPARDGREMEPATRTAVTDAYARALAALDRAGRGDDAAPIADYFSGPANAAAAEIAGAADRAPTETVHRRHDLRLDFYSDDGSIVALGVPRVEITRTIGSDDAATVVSSTERWRLVMLLEDGNWRIQQLEVVAVEERPVTLIES